MLGDLFEQSKKKEGITLAQYNSLKENIEAALSVLYEKKNLTNKDIRKLAQLLKSHISRNRSQEAAVNRIIVDLYESVDDKVKQNVLSQIIWSGLGTARGSIGDLINRRRKESTITKKLVTDAQEFGFLSTRDLSRILDHSLSGIVSGASMQDFDPARSAEQVHACIGNIKRVFDWRASSRIYEPLFDLFKKYSKGIKSVLSEMSSELKNAPEEFFAGEIEELEDDPYGLFPEDLRLDNVFSFKEAENGYGSSEAFEYSPFLVKKLTNLLQKRDACLFFGTELLSKRAKLFSDDHNIHGEILQMFDFWSNLDKYSSLEEVLCAFGNLEIPKTKILEKAFSTFMETLELMAEKESEFELYFTDELEGLVESFSGSNSRFEEFKKAFLLLEKIYTDPEDLRDFALELLQPNDEQEVSSRAGEFLIQKLVNQRAFYDMLAEEILDYDCLSSNLANFINASKNALGAGGSKFFTELLRINGLEVSHIFEAVNRLRENDLLTDSDEDILNLMVCELTGDDIRFANESSGDKICTANKPIVTKLVRYLENNGDLYNLNTVPDGPLNHLLLALSF